MASLRKQGDIWYVVYYNAEGKQKTVKGYTEKGLTRDMGVRLEAEKQAIKRGESVVSAAQVKATLTAGFTEHLATYQQYLEMQGLAPNYVWYSIADVKALMAHASITRMSEVTWAVAVAWTASMKRAGLSARTCNRKIMSVQAFLKHLKKTKAIAECVLEDFPKQQEDGHQVRVRRPLTKAEIDILLRCTPEPRRFLYQFAIRTGLRFAEIMSMSPSSFNFEDRENGITIDAKDAKSKRKQVIALHLSLVEPLKAMCQGREPDEKIFARVYKAARFVRADCERLMIDARQVDFHSLRHTFITTLARKKTDPTLIQKMARHSSITTTMKYVHRTQKEMLEAMDAID